MRDGGFLRLVALLATLCVIAGAFATVPYRNARAADKAVFGYVDSCGATGAEFLSGVSVSLTEAHSGKVDATSTGNDGFYSFNPDPGSYRLRFEISTHYSKDLPTFRFDGSVDVRNDICLTRMPTRDRSLKVLVVDSTQTLHSSEALVFTRVQVTNEDIDTRVNGTGIATTVHSPVVNGTASFHWRNATASFELVSPADYTWVNLFSGTIQINNAAILQDISVSTNNRWLNATYQWSSRTTRVQYFPIVNASYSVNKGPSPWTGQDTEWRLNIDTGVFDILANFVFGTDSASITYSSTNNVTGASVVLFNATASQSVASGTTDLGGVTTLSIWANTFQLQVQKETYEPFTATVSTSSANSTRAILVLGYQIFGIVNRADHPAQPIAGLVGFLYNTNVNVPEFKKVLTAKVQGSLYIFYAEHSQSYRMVIDADGYRASETSVNTLAGTFQRIDVSLTPSLREEFKTRVTYGRADWTALWVNRSLTLRSDSSIPGLKFPEVRSLSLQIDYQLGNRDGILSGGEVTNFTTWLQGQLAPFITTDGFLTTNGVIYNSTAASFAQNATVFRPSLAGPAAVFVNSTARYSTRGATVPNAKPTYYVNLTLPNDTNRTVYQDQVVVVVLPRGYEMTDKRITGSITTQNFTTVTVDPGIEPPSSSSIDMTIQKSANGTERIAVASPTSKFHVIDDTLKNYSAVVAANTNVTFSAEQSTDPNSRGPITGANFTWRFTNNTPPTPNRYNITATFNYTTTLLQTSSSHFFTVNLTIVEAGGNFTYRDAKIYVDDTPPVAVIKSNRTGAGNANGTTLLVDEDIVVKFDASLSSDIAYAGAPINDKDKIPDVEGKRGYKWDFDGDHVVDSFQKIPVKAFDTPGRFNATLEVVDWVGNSAALNATLTVFANDTTKPTPNWVILDPSNNWAVTTTLIEDKEYAFNASSSTDNYDENDNLTFKWHFPGPVVNATNSLTGGHDFSGRGLAGWNVSVKWTEFNLSYNVTLNVTDTGFRAPTDAQKPNWANRTSSVQVSVDVKQHPDLRYVAASLKIEPGQPEEGQLIHVSFMVDNDKNRANATNVRVVLTAKDPAGTVVLQSGDVRWFDDNWKPLALVDHRIDSGKKVHLVFLINFPSQGNKSLDIRFNDTAEPYTWVDGQNKVTGSLFVKLAGWVIPAAFVGIIALVIGVAFALRTYSKYKAGELTWFRRKEKKEKKEKKGKKRLEEEEPSEEEAEEETSAKKRL